MGAGVELGIYDRTQVYGAGGFGAAGAGVHYTHVWNCPRSPRSMTEFTAFLVLGLPPWPPSRRALLGRFSTVGEGSMQLIGHNDGHIEILLDDDRATALHFAKLTPSAQQRHCIVSIVSKDDGTIDLRIGGGEPLKLLSDSDGTEVDVPLSTSSTAPLRSYEDPAAAAACTAARTRRNMRMAGRARVPPRQGRRIKTHAEEAGELSDAVTTLDAELVMARHGDKIAARAAATRLRALVYWPNDQGSWNPLLLRIAARYDLPLPVYAEPPGDPQDLGLPAPIGHVRHLMVGCERPFSTFGIVDLEEYLASALETVVVNGSDETVSVGEVVAAVANTEYVHYDRDVPLVIDRLRSQVYLEVDLVDRLILSVGPAVSELARWVAREASAHP